MEESETTIIWPQCQLKESFFPLKIYTPVSAHLMCIYTNIIEKRFLNGKIQEYYTIVVYSTSLLLDVE